MTTHKGRVGIALFGIGRAGSIHIKNLAANPRVNVRWIVEEDVEKAKPHVAEYYLENTKIISNKEVNQVWNDDKWVWNSLAISNGSQSHVIIGI